jgi:hypothetical protein
MMLRAALWLSFAAVFATPPLAAAQPRAPQAAYRPPSPDPRNIAGAYQPQTNTKLFPADGSALPLTPWAQAIYDRRVAAAKDGEPEADASTACLPHGTPRELLGSFPIYIYQVDAAHSASGVDEVVFLHEIQHLVRHVYMNEQHPKDLDPTFLGHQVGRWDGNTLVVDTVGQNDKTWSDGAGIPHSTQVHVVERWRKINSGKQLEVMITLDDPVAFTKPWTAKRIFDWSPNVRQLEYVCEENNRNAPGETGHTGVIAPGGGGDLVR